VQLFALIGRYFWLICIAIAGLNYVSAVRTAADLTELTDAQRARRKNLIQRGFALSTLPWLVMGFGIVTRRVDGVFSYFDPSAGNVCVWAWYVSLFLVACGFCFWVFVRGGAIEIVDLKLLKAHGPRGEIPLSESRIKFFAAMGPLFVVLWVWMVWMMPTSK
jgi:hypothetical protein